MIPSLVFNHVIRRADGRYFSPDTDYTGTNPKNWNKKKHMAYTFTEKQAYYKVDNEPAFKGCTVERID